MKAADALEKAVAMFEGFDIPMEGLEATDGRTALHLVLKPTKPVRMKEIESYEKDLCFALGAKEIEIHAPIRGTATIGINVRKDGRALSVTWKKTRGGDTFQSLSTPLSFILGRDEYDKDVVVDLAQLPHLLVGGTTGGGKSVFLHEMLCTFLERNTPDSLRLILVDPKRVDLVLYKGIPHNLTEPIVDPKKGLMALKWLGKEMERRYNILEENRVRDIVIYRQKYADKSLREFQKSDVYDVEKMPYIVFVVDELSDLMRAYPRECEKKIVQLTQISRAVGIHLVLSTSSVGAKVLPGLVRANIPARVAFQTANVYDSRSIIDGKGAERLRGAGESLFLDGTMTAPIQVQIPYISEVEVKACVAKLPKDGSSPSEFEFPRPRTMDAIFASMEEEVHDELFDEAKQAVIEVGKATTSFLQRKLGIGYSRAAQLIDALENAGVIGLADGSKPREVIDRETI